MATRKRPAAVQASLFGDAPPAAPGNALRIQAAKLTPEQQRFNRLLDKVEGLTRHIEALRRAGDAHRAAVMRDLTPLHQRHLALMREMAVFLDERLSRPGLSTPQRRNLREILCALAHALAASGDAGMQAVHDRHSPRSLAQKQKDEAADLQAMFESAFDTELELEEDAASIEEILRAARSKAEALADAEAEAQQRRASRRRKPPTARQQQAAQAQQDAQTALRTLYRQLASALHPDRETDPAERGRKTQLMGEANAAYERRDLTALLHLQMRVEHIGEEGVARMAREKAEALCVLLKEQAAALQADLDLLAQQLMMEFELSPFLPVSEETLRAALMDERAQLRHDIRCMESDLQLVREDEGLKRWLRTQRAAQRDAVPF